MANRPKGYGMTAELAEKRAAQYDPALEAEARQWIEEITGEKISGSFAEYVKDGQVLCKLINQIKPSSVTKINESKMAFKQMENIGKFLTACENIGMNKLDLFQTVDLYEEANMAQVINAIFALGRKARKVDGFNGPYLGPEEATKNKREFTEEQMQAGKNVIGLQMGSNKGASQAGQSFGKNRAILD